MSDIPKVESHAMTGVEQGVGSATENEEAAQYPATKSSPASPPNPPTVSSPLPLDPCNSTSTYISLLSDTYTTPQFPSDPQLHHPTPSKSRSNSILQSSRPAPASPGSSRPGSAILSPSLGPSLSTSSSRDRAGSTSSSQGHHGRRVSGQASGRSRPRSQLGHFVLPGNADVSNPPSSTPSPGEANITAKAIPEDKSFLQPPLEPDEFTPPEIVSRPLIIRDYAFPSSDERFSGLGQPPPTTSNRNPFRWGSGSAIDTSPDPSGSRRESGSSKKGWGGFGLLGWKSLINRQSSSTSQNKDDGSSSESDEDDDYPLPAPDQDEDYPFSETSSQAEGEEGEDDMYGTYRAAYAFEALGEHERSMEEGDLVDVRGRGGGDGWVIAGMLDEWGNEPEGEKKEGLVPESYLERCNVIKVERVGGDVVRGNKVEEEETAVVETPKAI